MTHSGAKFMTHLEEISKGALDLNFFYEERIAMAEVDGKQSPKEAHRTVYLDAFISLLWVLAENESHQGWRLKKSKQPS